VRTLCLPILLIGLLAGGLAGHAQAQSASDSLTVSARLDSARAAWRANRAAAAIDLLRPLTDSDTASASTYALLGRSHQALRQHRAAVRAFEAALARGGRSAGLLTALGESYQALGRLSDAETAQRRALALDSTARRRQIRLRLAAVHEDQRDWAEAAALYRTLFAADTTNLFVRTRLAYALAQRGRRKAAIKQYRPVHRARPHDGPVALALTRLLADTQQYRAALSVARRTLGDRDTWAALWRRQADVAFQLDSLPVAEKGYEQALQHGDSSATTLRRLGIVRVGQNRPGAALPVLRAAYRRDTTQAATSFYLGTAYRGVDSLRRARAAYERAVDQASSGTLVDALTQLAPTYDAVGRLPEALDTYRLALRLQPGRTRIYFHLATLYDEHYRDKTVAARYYRRYLRRSSRPAPSFRGYAKRRLDALRPTLHLQAPGTASPDTTGPG